MRELSRELLASGKVVNLQAIRWQDDVGTERIWEMAERVGKPQAVMMIAWLAPSQRLLLVRQYRPPAGGSVIEFPAGIVEPGEPPDKAALRELYEETGYRGEIDHVLPPAYNTPGLSNETAHIVLMEIDENAAENINATPHPEGDEHIEVVLAPREEIGDFVERELAAGAQFDMKVLSYVAALMRAL